MSESAIQPTPRISVLIDATDQSGIYLARCLFALMTRSNLKRLNCEYLIMVDETDDANVETVNFFEKYMQTVEFLIGFAPVMSFTRRVVGTEDLPINTLAKAARGHWIFPIKASTIVKTENWDEHLIEKIEAGELNPAAINFIQIPLTGANMGSPLYLVSQGYYLTLDRIAPHIHVEDYIFLLVKKLEELGTVPATMTTIDPKALVIEDQEWGSWERSLPEGIDTQISSDIETLTRMIKAGH